MGVNAQKLNTCRILFLEDNVHDVELMKQELQHAGFNSFKHVTSKKDFLDALDDFKPDIILADYSLPMFNGMHAFRLFKEKQIFIPFILVTGSLNEQLAAECLSEGVDDFILKSGYSRLPSIITRSLEIKSLEKEKEKIAAELQSKNEELKLLRENAEKARAHELLSNREFEILCLIGSGRSIKEIADQLFISPATVATYRARILEKTDMKSNVDLARYVIEHKLLD
jgi:DNA-binding NarL/FixJ family response regulator